MFFNNALVSGFLELTIDSQYLSACSVVHESIGELCEYKASTKSFIEAQLWGQSDKVFHIIKKSYAYKLHLGRVLHPSATNHSNNNISILNAYCYQDLKSVQVGRPVEVAITPNGMYAYVANADSNSVSLIDTGKTKVVKTIQVLTKSCRSSK